MNATLVFLLWAAGGAPTEHDRDAAPELHTDRVGMTVVCAADVPRHRPLTRFDEVPGHDDPAERKVVVAEWARAQRLVCLD